MFELIRNNTKALMFVLVVLIIPSFVFLGVQGYSGFGEGNATVATVAGQKITQAEWDNAHRSQVERLRAQAPGVDVKLLDTPEMKQQTLEALVRDRLMRVAADKLHLSTGDERVQRLFRSDPQLAFLRKPDGSIDTALLNAQGLSAQQFEQQLRRDYAMQQVLLGVSGSTLAPTSAMNAALDALLQQREVRVARFESKNYLAQVQPSDADIAAYYNDPAHAKDFESPERAAVEYVVLDLDAIKAGLQVSDADLRKYYDENANRYGSPEERRASHILIKAERAAPAAERDKAKAKATALLAELRKTPARFAELAKANSDDPGSAAQGGDLDYFGRGAMTKPFEDGAYALKIGEISDVVESEFGFHIIQLTAVRGGEKRSFEAVRTEVEAEVRQQLAQRRFAEVAETFSNTVYEQADSLQPVADALKLQVRKADAVTRVPAQGVEGALANAKFLAALFEGESLRSKRNTEAVEIGANQLAAGRVVNYAAARKLPLDEVKAQVRTRVVAAQAAALARKDGQAKLAAWRGGAAAEAFEPPLTVSRAQAQTLPRPLIDAVMRAPPSPLPSWTGVDFGDEGYAVVRIDKLLPRDPASGDPKQLRQQYGQLWGAAEAEAYYAALRERYKVEVSGQAGAAPAADGAAR
ncbi:MAG: SurA N-terminal domain-containing protein [Pseudomonadota bacterium]